MSQLEVSKAEAAEERSEQTRSFVRTVKAAARRKYTPEEKIRIVLEGFRREVTVSDLCRREGIKPHSYYSWTKEFMEAGKERLTRDSVRDATQHEVGQLKRENGRNSRSWKQAAEKLPGQKLPGEGCSGDKIKETGGRLRECADDESPRLACWPSLIWRRGCQPVIPCGPSRG